MGEHHPHDKGYKELYSNKSVFLDLLRNVLRLDWARDVGPEDLTLTDKSYVTGVFTELESDLVYRMKLREQEVILYVLLEFQRKVDHQMPVRLLFYMVEILREYLRDSGCLEKQNRHKKPIIPAIFPIVLYNGKGKWTAKRSLREITANSELCGENVLDLHYSVVDVNHGYTEEELLCNDCISSIILLLDKRADTITVVKRLGEIIERFKSLGEGENREIIEQWLRHAGNPQAKENLVSLLRADKEEVPKMVSNLQDFWIKDIREARQKAKLEGRREGKLEGKHEGRMEGKREILRALAESGMSVELIAKNAKMSPNDVRKLLQ